MRQPNTGIIGEGRSSALGDELTKRLQIFSSNKNSLTNNSHTNSPNNSNGVRRRARSH